MLCGCCEVIYDFGIVGLVLGEIFIAFIQKPFVKNDAGLAPVQTRGGRACLHVNFLR